jgi:hypothetical protein
VLYQSGDFIIFRKKQYLGQINGIVVSKEKVKEGNYISKRL